MIAAVHGGDIPYSTISTADAADGRTAKGPVRAIVVLMSAQGVRPRGGFLAGP